MLVDVKEAISEVEDEEDYTPVNWKHKDNENCYFAYSWLDVACISFFEVGDNEPILKYVRVFKTEEECKKYCEIQKAFRDKARPFILGEKNYSIAYRSETDRLLISTLFYDQENTLYFEKNDLKELKERFSKSDIKRYYFNIDD